MTVPLPKLIGDYFAASNAHDAEAMALAFASDAVVHDERKMHRGRAAIATWAQGTIDKYQTTIVPFSVSDGGGGEHRRQSQGVRYVSRQPDRTDIQLQGPR